MKKILALTIVLVMVLGLALVSCESAIDQNALDTLNGAKESLSGQLSGITGENYGDFKTNKDNKIELLDGMTPVQKYDEAFDVVNSLTNFTLTADQDINMVMNYQGQTIKQDMVQTIVQKYQGDNFSIVGNATSAGMQVPSSNCQYVDGIVYNVQPIDGQMIKYSATKDQLSSLVGVDTDEPKIFDIPESWFEDVCFYEESNGNRAYLEIILSGEQYEQMFSNLALLSSVTSITDITHRVYFDENGDFDSIVTTATMKLNVSGIDTTASFVSTSTISDIGSTVVEAPANADAYRTVSVNDLV